ncbi:hypothetical protein POI8812_03529 [Pontivivens insulae]|uniref:Uncharacterized protein n=1 Tax=Pontivivens insulae TaxID=1639689 RepID=A0A2R8AGH8_9RHOB|nr:hypothetical protein DFR53_3547 [Pontivivens insulae]SPF31178.1 hypothetical protein POI8812_03529 [Pontivivens insulae]
MLAAHGELNLQCVEGPEPGTGGREAVIRCGCEFNFARL